MNKKISLVQIKKDKNIFEEILFLLKNEYLNSFMSLNEFGNLHSISMAAIKYVLDSCGLKKDMSKFNSSKREDTINNIQKTKLQRYGDPFFNNCEKNKKTCLERYGVEHARQLDSINKKGIDTFLNHYKKGSKEYDILINQRVSTRNKTLETINFGDKIRKTRSEHSDNDPYFLDNIQNKRILTTLAKYGVDNVSKSEEIKILKKETLYNHFGADSWWNSPEIRSKYEKTCLQKYGNNHFSKTLEYARGRSHKWVCENKTFDSKWEIYYYFYLKDNNIEFEYQVPLDYMSNGKQYIYFCDFKINSTGELIEIKNPALLNENNELQLLWKKGMSDDKISAMEQKLNDKTICMKNNNVIILSEESFFKDLENKFKENHPELEIKNLNENN